MRYEDELLRRFPQLPRLPRYSYTVLSGLAVLSVVMCMGLCASVAFLASLQPPTPTPQPTPEPTVLEITCDDPQAPDMVWLLDGNECLMQEERLEGGGTHVVELSYPYDIVAANPFMQPIILNVLRSLRDGFWQQRAETPTTGEAGPWSLQVTTQMTAFSPNVVSLLFTVGAYTGGAHPFSYYETLTFDLATQTTLELPDIFQDGVDPYPIIAPLARVQLLTQYPDLADFINPGTEPEAENFDTWGLSSDSLIIYFSQMDVGPSALGNQQVSIPLASLADSLKPQFVP